MLSSQAILLSEFENWPANVGGFIRLVAQPQLSEISTHFRAGSDTYGIGPYVILTIVPILLGVGLTAVYKHTMGGLPGTKATDKLFIELCQAHKLSRYEALLLRRMAKAIDQPNPGVFFLLEHQFNEAAEALLEGSEQKKTAAAIESLRGRLFGCEVVDAAKE